MDNEGGAKVTSPVPPPVINLETAVPSGSTSASSSICEDGPPGSGVGDVGEGSSAGNGGSGGGSTSGAGELKVPALHNLKLTESGRLK